MHTVIKTILLVSLGACILLQQHKNMTWLMWNIKDILHSDWLRYTLYQLTVVSFVATRSLSFTHTHACESDA